MHTVIVGAGVMGTYLAATLSKKENDITVVDINNYRLAEIAADLDVATRHGSGADWQLLEELMELGPSILLALTQDDMTNMAACTIAKNLGYVQTFARVHDEKFLNQVRLDFHRLFYVDHFICPELLAAQDILKCTTMPGSKNVESFIHGAASMRTFVVPAKWRFQDKPLHELGVPKGAMVGLLYRQEGKGKGNIIFPHGADHILPGDEVTFIGETDVIRGIHHFFGEERNSVNFVVIIGGTLLGLTLARILIRSGVAVQLVDGDYEKCCYLAERLPTCTVLHHYETDVSFFESERFSRADYLVACTESDEKNLLIASLARQIGCKEVVAAVDRPYFSSLTENLGISFTISSRESAANRILSVIEAETVTSMISLYHQQAEIMEIKVTLDSKVAGIPLAALGSVLPRDFLIAVIYNRGRIMVADGNKILCPGDTIIAISSPEHIKELDEIF